MKLLGMSIDKIAERQVKKAGITFGDIWRDPDLAAALPAVRAGDIARARELLDIDDPHRSAFRLNVLSEECTPHLPVLEERYGDDDPLLLLLGGSTRIKGAWDIRGGGWASGVGEERFDRFHAFLEPAAGILMRAAELAPEDPRPWDQLQWYCLGMDIRREDLDRMWLELCARDSWHHHGRYSRLQVLCRKWRGSHEEMFAFARENAALSGPGDACLGLLPAAHKENIMLTVRDGEENKEIQTFGDLKEFVEGYLADPEVHGELAKAADAVPLTAEQLADLGEYAGEIYDYQQKNPHLLRLMSWEGLAFGDSIVGGAVRADFYADKIATLADAQRTGEVSAEIGPEQIVYALIALTSFWSTLPHLGRLMLPEAGDEGPRADIVALVRRLTRP
jgi:hypothetical protein